MPLDEDYDAGAREQLNANHVFVDTPRKVRATSLMQSLLQFVVVFNSSDDVVQSGPW